MRLHTDRVDHFPFGLDELWARVERVDRFVTWWSWLRAFDGEELASGEVWRCVIRPPAPYTVRCSIELIDVDPRAHVAARIDGDIEGTARLTVAGDGARSTVRLVSDLQPASRTLRAVSNLAPRLVRRSHDWVVEAAVEQFRRAPSDGAAG